MSRRWIAALAVLLLLLGGTYLGSPYWAVRSFTRAVKDGDTAGLSAAIDFPAVRDSLKPQVAAGLRDRLAKDRRLRDNPIAALGSLFAPALVDRALDAVVTPDGIAALIRNQRPLASTIGVPATPSRVVTSSSWRDLDHFRVESRNGETGKPGPVLVFERHGLFVWKLARLELPAWMISTGDAPTS